MKKYAFFCLSLVFLCGCTYLSFIRDPFINIPNFHRIDNVLYIGGRPTKKGWEKIKFFKVKSVINLENDDINLTNEQEFLASAGINFYNLPMSVYAMPTDEQALRYLEIILNKSNQPVFLHCNNGRDRTGAMLALYRVVVCGWTIKNAYKEIGKFGFWPYHGDEAPLKKFVHQLKDKKIFFQKVKEMTGEEKY